MPASSNIALDLGQLDECLLQARDKPDPSNRLSAGNFLRILGMRCHSMGHADGFNRSLSHPLD